MLGEALGVLKLQIEKLNSAVNQQSEADTYLRLYEKYGPSEIVESDSETSNHLSYDSDHTEYNFEPPNALVGLKAQDVLQHLPVYLVEQPSPGEYRLPIPKKRWTEHELYMRRMESEGYFSYN